MLFSVILLPQCATFSWYHVTIAFVIKFAFGKMTGCTLLISSIDLLNLSPTLRTPSVSRKGFNLKRLLDLCIVVFDFNVEIPWLNECCCSILNIILWACSNSSKCCYFRRSGFSYPLDPYVCCQQYQYHYFSDSYPTSGYHLQFWCYCDISFYYF